MTTKPVSVKVQTDATGKVRVVPKPPRLPAGQARNRKMKTARLARMWAERSKTK